jgi:ParB family chromosome partitioning protein
MSGRGLGAGLGAIFGEDVVEESLNGNAKEVDWLPIAKIEPREDQPRSDFDEVTLSELAESIKEHGLIQPIIVRELDGGYYQIIAGERRWRASRLAGLDKVPVRIIKADDKKAMELALVENLQREDLNPVEEAKGYKTLMQEYGLTQEQAAKTVGKSRPVVANSLRLLKLPEEILKVISEDKLSLSHARAILELDDPEKQKLAAKKIVEGNLTVREATSLIKNLNKGEKPVKIKEKTDDVDYVAELEQDISKSLGRKVRIIRGRKKGKIEIEYYSEDDFESICENLIKFGKNMK